MTIDDDVFLDEHFLRVASNPPSAVPALPVKPDTQVNVDALTAAVNHLVTKLDSHPNSLFDWATPATHFVDSLPGYNTLTLGMVLAVVVLLGMSIIIAWSLYRKNAQDHDMLKAMVVPLEAFTAVVQQSAASTEMLGRRIEELGSDLGTTLRGVSTSMSQMAAALNAQQADYQQRTNTTHQAQQRLTRPQG